MSSKSAGASGSPPVESVHALYLQSVAARQRGDHEVAGNLLRSALSLGPAHPGPWYALGVELHNKKLYAGAIAAVSRALELRPDEYHALTNLGIYLHQSGKWHEARNALIQAVSLAPNEGLGWANLCLTETALGNYDAAIAAGLRSLEISPGNPSFTVGLSFAYLTSGRLAEGFAAYEGRFAYKLQELTAFPQPKWAGEPCDSIFLTAEQGFGDTLIFARFIPLVQARVKTVYFGCPGELAPLMARAFPKVRLVPMPAVVPETSYHCPLMSIPHALGLSTEEIREVRGDYLTKLPHRPKVLRQSLPKVPGRKFHIGIVYAGNPDQESDTHRSTSIETFLPLAELPGVQLYSLQTGPRAYDALRYPGLVIPLHPLIRSFEDTVELLCELDALVSVCTAPVHLAGAMGGPPTYVVLPACGRFWLWEDVSSTNYMGRMSSWHGNVEAYVQVNPGDWADVFHAVSDDLWMHL